MDNTTYTKDEYFKGLIENTKQQKAKATKFAENNFVLGNSEFADGYNSALIHFIEYFKK